MTAVLDHAGDLEKLLLEWNVTVFGYERSGDLAIVRFRMNDQKLRLIVKMPDFNDETYRLTSTGKEKAMTVRRSEFWRDVAATWKAMRNLIAAKLAAIDAGITTFETEFRQFEDAEALLGPGATPA